MAVKKVRLTPRFFWPDLWDLPGTESWLADMAAHGLHFHGKGNAFVWFARGAPMAVRYRLDAVSSLSPIPGPERRGEAAELGWQYVDELDDFSVYVCRDPETPELHTDPVTQSCTMDQIARKLCREIAMTAVVLPLVLALLSYGVRWDSFSVLALVERSSALLLLPVFLLQLIQLPISLWRCARLLCLRRRLKAGLPMEHRANYKQKARLSAIFSLLSFLFFGLYLYAVCRELSSSQSRSITAGAAAPIPYSLAELEMNSSLRPLHFAGPYGETDYANFVDASWSLLAPTQYEITQSGEIPGQTWQGGDAYQPRLVMHYYELIISPLAEPLLHDILQKEGDGRIRTELTCPGLDEAVLLTIPQGSFSMLLLRTDRRLLWLEYWGSADLAAELPVLAAVLSAQNI